MPTLPSYKLSKSTNVSNIENVFVLNVYTRAPFSQSAQITSNSMFFVMSRAQLAVSFLSLRTVRAIAGFHMTSLKFKLQNYCSC